MALPDLAPITDKDIREYCEFLSRHLNPTLLADDFLEAFSRRWGMDQPNHGFLIRDDDSIVGGIGAIYAVRTVRGKPERFCNITSWCVLQPFRSQSMRLAMALVSQEGFHYTDLTPTELVAKSLQFLKFRPLDASRTVIPNAPGISPGVQVVTEPKKIHEALPPAAAQVYDDHVSFPWLLHVAVGKPGAFCYVIFKRKMLKGMPSAEVMGVSDGELFLRYHWAFGRHVLLRHGMVTTRVESRLLPRKPVWAKKISGYRPKMYRSESLNEKDIDNFYSELVSLDL